MKKLPAFQLYPGDWRKDPGVQSLSYHDRGVWFEILCLMSESSDRGKLLLNGRAMPDEALARLLGLDNQILTTTLTTLLTFGVASRCEDTGALMSRRMVRDEILRKTRTESGKKGGNPILVNHEDNHLVNQNPTTQDKQIPTPSSSSSEEDERRKGNLYPERVEDVIKHARSLNMSPAPDEAFCHWWFDTMEACSWVDNLCRPIRNWKRALQAAWSGGVHNRTEKAARYARRPPTPTARPVSTFEPPSDPNEGKSMMEILQENRRRKEEQESLPMEIED